MSGESSGRRRLKYGGNVVVGTLFVFAILVLANYIATRHPKRFDLTEGQLYSLSDQTLKLLSELQEEIHIEAFFQETHDSKKKLEDLLKEYRYHSSKFYYEFIDPVKNPVLAQQMGVTEDGTAFIRRGEKTQRIKGETEQEVTNALIQITRGSQKKACFTSGHGENDLSDTGAQGYSTAKEELEREGYSVAVVQLFTEDVSLSECHVLVVSAPQKALLEAEQKRLADYFNGGGRVLIQLDPYQDGGLREWLHRQGLLIEEDIVVDRLARLFSGDIFTPFIGDYPEHPITERFNLATFFPGVRSISHPGELPSGVEVSDIARTGEQSWAETDKAVFEFNSEEDSAGPVTIAVAMTRQEEEAKEGRLVVFGDSGFANNTYFSYSGNGDFFLNAISWLVEQEDLISIRPKETGYTPVQMTREQISKIFWGGVVALPLFCVFTGIVVWLFRRRR
jgi:ABC-type uncharacterized transport system involved in gliding motility auxiliary subunit